MRRNIELKTRCTDVEGAKAKLRALGAVEQRAMRQVDTYFNPPRGRLKLREIEGERTELIWYEREDAAKPRGSDYVVVEVADARGMKVALGGAMGVKVVVKKK